MQKTMKAAWRHSLRRRDDSYRGPKGNGGEAGRMGRDFAPAASVDLAIRTPRLWGCMWRTLMSRRTSVALAKAMGAEVPVTHDPWTRRPKS